MPGHRDYCHTGVRFLERLGTSGSKQRGQLREKAHFECFQVLLIVFEDDQSPKLGRGQLKHRA